jgi:hypothetical protein
MEGFLGSSDVVHIQTHADHTWPARYLRVLAAQPPLQLH